MSARLPEVPPGAHSLRLVGGTLIDGTGADPLDDAEIEIRAGRIVYAGGRRARDVAGVEVIDVRGGHLMPGFVDAHVHLVMSTDADVETQRDWFPEQAVMAALGNLRSTVEAGVTTARDLSGLTPGYRHGVASGSVVGPRLHLAIAMLSPTGGHADPERANGSLPLWAERATTPGWAVVDTDAEVVKAVRRLMRSGADAIKVCTSGGVTSPHDSPSDLGIPQEHVELIAAEARARQGQPIAAHAQNDAGVRAAVLGGAASVEHGYDMTDETIGMMLERGTVLVPTLSTLHRPRPRGEGIARAEMIRRADESIERAIRAGVVTAMGTDAGIHVHGRNLVELGHLARAGLSPMATIHAGTLAGARLLRLQDHVGSLEVGKLADVVVTAADPLADIGALAEPAAVRAVLLGGRLVKDLDGLAG
ncbi:MAG: amidohydrolase family protein [Microbacterium sp.]